MHLRFRITEYYRNPADHSCTRFISLSTPASTRHYIPGVVYPGIHLDHMCKRLGPALTRGIAGHLPPSSPHSRRKDGTTGRRPGRPTA